MKNLLSYSFLLGVILLSCSDDGPEDVVPDDDNSEQGLGLFRTEQDDLSTVPSSTNFGFSSSANLPSSYDLTENLPPVGNQGRYGTCVAWAVAYNSMTMINGINQGYTSSELSIPSNQFSPKDLFTAIPASEKGSDCNGTGFDAALDILQTRGVNTVDLVPYEDLGDCDVSNTFSGNASTNRIKYWRQIEGNQASVKQSIANNMPVIVGAKLDDSFMRWNTEEVYSSFTTFDRVGIHAYHAVAVIGYDDNRGANGAFKLVNSWGEGWANDGFIWIDYEHFFNDFVISYSQSEYELYVMAIEETQPEPEEEQSEIFGVDLASWVFEDYSTDNFEYPTERFIRYNIYNLGNEPAHPSKQWAVYYLYFNAYDANDYDFLFFDSWTDAYSEVPFGEEGEINLYEYAINKTLPANSDYASALYELEDIEWLYYMPQLNGAYYLLLIADAYDDFPESNETNNVFYTTSDPIVFSEGQAARSSGLLQENAFAFNNHLKPDVATSLRVNDFQSVVTERNRNAYTTNEIQNFIKEEKRSGRLDQKLASFQRRKRPE